MRTLPPCGLLALTGLLLLSAASLGVELEPGLHEKLLCGGARNYSYTVYLPPAYARNTEALPVLFLSSPGGNPNVSEWKNWANAHETVIVGINDTKNGMQEEDFKRIQDAVLDSAKTRLRLHPFLRFSAGVSGGAWASAYLAQRQGERWGGVLFIVHGGNGMKPDPKVPVALLVGEQDKTYPFEGVQRACFALRKAGNVIRLESYPGLGHGGVPQADSERMLDWLLENARLTHPLLSEAERKQARERISARLQAAPKITDPARRKEELERLALLPGLKNFPEAEVQPVLAEWAKHGQAWTDGLKDPRTQHFYLRYLLGHPATALLSAPTREALQGKLDECRKHSPVKEEWEAEQAYFQLPDYRRVPRTQAARIIGEYEAFAKHYPDTPAGAQAALVAKSLKDLMVKTAPQ